MSKGCLPSRLGPGPWIPESRWEDGGCGMRGWRQEPSVLLLPGTKRLGSSVGAELELLRQTRQEYSRQPSW